MGSVANSGAGLINAGLGGLGGVAGATLGAAGSVIPGMGGALNKLGSGINSSPVGYMLGQAGGINGTGISGPQTANIQEGTNAGQVQQAQNRATNSLESQNALLAALQGQNGLGQQNAIAGQQQAFSNQLAAQNGIGNQMGAMNQQQGLNAQLAAANGVGTQNSAISGLQNVAGQQQGTANMYSDIAQGRGPNPAQAMLNQATGQNVANQAALMAGQRGAGSNVGLMARQAAQQGAATQQQAVGQGATMQANQQLGALSGLTAQQQAMAGTQQAIGGLGTTQAGMQQAGISQQAQQAAQQIAQQQAAQQALANQANIVAGQQIAGTTAGTQAALANAGQLQGALGAQNTANVSSQNSINAANAALANTAMQGQQKMVGGVLSGAGAAIGAARGGEVPHMAEGGIPPAPVGAVTVPMAPPPPTGPVSGFGTFLKNWGSGTTEKAPTAESKEPNYFGDQGDPLQEGASKLGKGIGSLFGDASPMAKGGLANSGGHVKAKSASQAPVKKGNSYDNDKVPAMLSAGEIVLPRSVTKSQDPVNASAAFVQQVLAKRKAKS